MNIPGQNQIDDPIVLEAIRAQRQADLDYVFNPVQINARKNAERKAALPGKKMAKAERRARKNARALEIQGEKEQRAKLAREQVERLKAQQAAEAVAAPKTVSSSGVSKTQSSLKVSRKREYRGFKKDLMNGFRVERDSSGLLAIPDPATMKPGSLEHYARKNILLPRFERQAQLDAGNIVHHYMGLGIYEGMSENEIQTMLTNTAEQLQGDLLREHLKDLKRYHGPNYRAHLRQMATDHLNTQRSYAAYNLKLITDDPIPVKPILPIGLSKEDAVAHISKRVAADGGTLAKNKNLTGFGEGVRSMVDQSIISRQEVAKIIQSKNLLELTPNAAQVASALDLEELYRLPYGEALWASQQGVGMSVGQQIKAGRAIGLNEKHQMMIDDAVIQREAQAAKDRAERVQAVLTSDMKPQNEYRTFKALDEAAERALETTNKAPIAKRTVEKLMESHTLAAGVAAGGLGLLYAANRLRAERQVGR